MGGAEHRGVGHLLRQAGGGDRRQHIVFGVRHDASTSDILFQTSDTSGTDGANGVYRYGSSGFPSSSYASSNYWVDVVLATD